MFLGQYESARNAAHVGRGRVFFTPPLLPTGGVNPTAYGRTWGTNWPSTPQVLGEPQVAPGRFVGNGRGLTVQPSLTRLNTVAWDARGNAVVDSVAASLTLFGHGAANLADALHGLRRQYAGTPVTEQIRTSGMTLDAGGMLFTQHLVDAGQPLAVAASWASWTEGVHWRREAFGVQLLAGMAAPPGSFIAITYTPEGSTEEVQALGNLALELGVVYVGVNAVDGRATRLELFRARPDLGGAMQPLAEGFSTLTLNFTLQPVRTAPGRPLEWFRSTRGNYPTTI